MKARTRETLAGMALLITSSSAVVLFVALIDHWSRVWAGR